MKPDQFRKLFAAVSFGVYFGAGFYFAREFGCSLIGEPSDLLEFVRSLFGGF